MSGRSHSVAPTVRSGTTDDVPAAAAVWVLADDARRSGLGLTGSADVARFVDLYLARLAAPTSTLLVAEADEEVVGMALVMQAIANDGAGPGIERGAMHVSSVAVHPARWGQGIGRRLVASVLAGAPALGYERVQLWTHESNTRAQALYRGLEFRPSGRTKIDDVGELIGHWVHDLVTASREPARP